MSKRNRQELNKTNSASAPVVLPAPDAGPNAHFANAADDGTPALAYGPNIGVLICTQLSDDSTDLLTSIVSAEMGVQSAEALRRQDRVASTYGAAARMQATQVQADVAVRQEVAMAVATEFIVCMSRGMGLEGSSRRCNDVCTDYGLRATADLRQAIRQSILKLAQQQAESAMSDDSQQHEYGEPVLTSEEHVQVGSVRPVAGATSGAAYLAGERETGYPPKYRQAWRYPVQAGEGATVLDPALLAEARMALRRPAFPDRLYPGGTEGEGYGSPYSRAIALATLWDEAQAQEQQLAQQQMTALQALRHVGQL
jgi:hypothetical protein